MRDVKLVAFVLASLMLLAGCEQAKNPSLVEIDSKTFSDPELAMTAKELDRNEKTSTVRVVRTKGASVPSSMFLLRAFYQIATARQCEYFINLKEWPDQDGSRIYIIGFTNNKDADLKQEFGDQYEYDNGYGQQRGYFSVSELDSLNKIEKQQDSPN